MSNLIKFPYLASHPPPENDPSVEPFSFPNLFLLIFLQASRTGQFLGFCFVCYDLCIYLFIIIIFFSFILQITGLSLDIMQLYRFWVKYCLHLHIGYIFVKCKALRWPLAIKVIFSQINFLQEKVTKSIESHRSTVVSISAIEDRQSAWSTSD